MLRTSNIKIRRTKQRSSKAPDGSRSTLPLPSISRTTLNYPVWYQRQQPRQQKRRVCAVTKAAHFIFGRDCGRRSRPTKRERHTLRGGSAAATLPIPSDWTHLVGHPDRNPLDLSSLPTFPLLSLGTLRVLKREQPHRSGS